jgi:hypothetical protein
MASPAARAAETEQQENEDFSPHVRERDILMSLSSLIDHLRINDAQGTTPLGPSPIAATNSSATAEQEALVNSAASWGVDEESLRHFTIFISILQRSDAELASELGQIVKGFSSDNFADVASLRLKPETRVALEAYIDSLQEKNRSTEVVTSSPRSETTQPSLRVNENSQPQLLGPSPVVTRKTCPPEIEAISDSSNGLSLLDRVVSAVSVPLNLRTDQHALSTDIADTTAGFADISPPPAIKSEYSGIGGFRSKSEDSMERLKIFPRSGVEGLQGPSVNAETIEDCRSTSGDSLDRLKCSPRIAPVEIVNNILSDDSMARYTRSPKNAQNVSPRHCKFTPRRDEHHRGVASDSGFLCEKEDGVVAESPTLPHESQRVETTSLRLGFRRPGRFLSSISSENARSAEELPDLSAVDNDPICCLNPNNTKDKDAGAKTAVSYNKSKPTGDIDEVRQSETFASNDLDTVALSLLGHYIDEIAARPSGNKKVNSGPRHRVEHITQDDIIEGRCVVQRRMEEHETDPLVGVDTFGFSSTSGDSSSQQSTDLSSFAPAVAAAKKAAAEAARTTTGRQKLDPPSVSTEGERHDPPTLRSPKNIDVDHAIRASFHNEAVFPLTVDVKFPGQERVAVKPGSTSYSTSYSPRDPEVISGLPRVDTTGELNPRCVSATSRPEFSPTCSTIPSATANSNNISRFGAPAVDRIRAGARTVSSWNSPSNASSADRGSVKIIFFDKAKGKRNLSKKSNGVAVAPSVCERDEERTDRFGQAANLTQVPSQASAGDKASFGRIASKNSVLALLENQIEAESELPPLSPLTRPESSSVLEPIIENVESPTAPKLSLPTTPDDDQGKSLELSVSVLRNEMGSSDGEASLMSEEKKFDFDKSISCKVTSLPQMQDMISQNDPDETVRKLWKLIPQPEFKPTKGKGNPEEDRDHQYDKFSALVDIAIPFFDGRFPTPVEKAHLQVQARRKGIPVSVTNSFMDALCSLSEREAALDLNPVPKSIHELSKSGHPSIRREALLRRLLRLKEAERRRDVMIYSSAVSSEEEAVEIDLAGLFQFAMNEYDSSSEESADGEWWESTAKLTKVLERSRDSDDLGFSGSSSQEYYDTETDTDNDSHGKKARKPPSVEDEIRGFWKSRKRFPRYYRLRQRGGLPSNGTASFSATENDGTSTSASSVSTTRYDPEADEELWARKRDIAMWPKGPNGGWLSRLTSNNWIRAPEPINAVNATVYFVLPSFVKRRYNPGTQQWAQPYEPRIAAHTGYFSVNVKSLYDASSQYGIQHPQDLLPWERRDVKQRFLQEQSVSYNRNWFGTTKKVYGNDRLRQPVCRPKSMEMPMKAGEWTEEWYKKPWESISIAQSLSAGDVELREIAAIRKRYAGRDEEEEISWEETPECGTIRNFKLKIGERVTRVTPDLTCSLRRSRWRKKFFPKGTFPY